jgi:16S rRNA (guanine966-N2)-methyltransferase
MRVVGGKHSGRRLQAPAGDATRPTSDKVREAIFNRLAHGGLEVEVDPLSGPVLDLYAGSGAFGIEALSRGAPRADLVEFSRPAIASIRANVTSLGLGDELTLHATRVEAFVRRASATRFQLVFADPPYADAGAPLERALLALVGNGGLADEALVVVEHGHAPAPAESLAGLTFLDRRAYGQTFVSFFVQRTRGIAVGA